MLNELRPADGFVGNEISEPIGADLSRYQVATALKSPDSTMKRVSMSK